MIATLESAEPTGSALVPHQAAEDWPYMTDPDFAGEKPGAQAEVHYWWPIMEAVAAAPEKTIEIEAQARAHHQSIYMVKRMYYGTPHKAGWAKTGHYSSLVNRAKYPDPRDASLPAAFAEFVCTRHDANQRALVGKRAIDAVMAALAAWERDPHNPDLAIPGFDTLPRRNGITGHPDGWSKDNLYRILREHSNAYTKALRKQGSKAASIYLPKVHTTRAEMYFGEVLYFDDVVIDNYVNLTGRNARALRPLGFGCMEAMTGSILEMGFKPELEKRDATGAVNGKRQLNQDEFFWFVMWNLNRHGYSPRGTALVFEWSTANVDKRDREAHEDHFDNLIRKVTGNCVRVERSGRFRNPAFRDMLFGGDGSGNFRFKFIESYWNLFKQYAGFLAAPSGRNPNFAPEENHGLVAYNDRLLKQVDRLPRDRFLQLQRPVWEWEQMLWALRQIIEIVDHSPDHELEGWEKLQFRKQRYRLDTGSEAWMSEEAYLSLPAGERAIYDHIVRQPGYFESRRLSRREARERMTREQPLRSLPSWLIPQLAPPRMWQPCSVRQDLEIHITAANEDEFVDTDTMIFLGKVRNAHGHEINLERGKKYFRLLNVFDPSQLWIAEADGSQRGRFIGLARRVQMGGKFDAERTLEQLGEVNHIRTVESAEVRARTTASAVEARMEMREHNRQVATGTTPAERTAARQRQRAQEKAVQVGRLVRDAEAAAEPETAAEAWTLSPEQPETQPQTDIEKW
jgi:hypothetical protein